MSRDSIDYSFKAKCLDAPALHMNVSAASVTEVPPTLPTQPLFLSKLACIVSSDAFILHSSYDISDLGVGLISQTHCNVIVRDETDSFGTLSSAQCGELNAVECGSLDEGFVCDRHL